MLPCHCSTALLWKFIESQTTMANSLVLSDHPTPPRGRSRKQPASNSAPSSSSPLCEQSPAATVDIIVLILVLGSCGFLFTPYFKYICFQAAEILPATFLMIGEVVYQAPVAYGAGAVLIFITVIGAVEIYHYRSRKCDNPRCKGLKKAMEFDIQLQTEECLKSSSKPNLDELPWKGGIELRPEHKELQTELRRMAPPNGRAVLLFRAPCGCPIAKLEAWGPKRVRRSKR
eukprot:Gb_24596 [translate_table: standard]